MKKNIMIIDDSALMRRVLSDIINTTEQYQVVYAAVNGKDGLEAMQRLTPIHFIFLDINMPVMDGVELLRKMKQNKIRIPTVVFSTVAERSSVETIEELSLGEIDLLKKPENILVNMAYFREKVRSEGFAGDSSLFTGRFGCGSCDRTAYARGLYGILGRATG